MKFRKSLLLFAILAVVFALTGCSNNNQTVFEYDESALSQSVLNTLTTITSYSEEEALYFQNTADEVYAGAVANAQTAKKECGEFIGFTGYTLKEKSDTIEIVYTAQYATREVEYVCTIEKNPAYEYDKSQPELQFAEIVASPKYTFVEMMGKAGANTMMGMGTVFAVLIFISIIISFFKYIPKLFDKKAKKKADESKKTAQTAVDKATPAKAAPAASNATTENLMNDAQLVAVITAAINAYESANGSSASYPASKDTLVVRSITRARR